LYSEISIPSKFRFHEAISPSLMKDGQKRKRVETNERNLQTNRFGCDIQNEQKQHVIK
jgi:hypothetical protein